MAIYKCVSVAGATLLVLAMASVATLRAAPADAPPSAQQVRELMQVLGVGHSLGQMNTRMGVAMQRSLPCVPASYWQGFISADASNQLIARMVPIYQKHFTAQDIDGLLSFYRSPLGQKVIREMPQTTAEVMQVSRQWGQKRGQQMIVQLKNNGTLDAQGKCPAAPATSK